MPTVRKTIIHMLSLAVGAMIEAQMPNTIELANVLPLPTERQGMREQWLQRLLKNPLLESVAILEPFARTELEGVARNVQPIILIMDPTELGNQ